MKMIKVIGKKTLYNIDNKQTASVWIREDVKDIKTQDAPQMKSGLKIKTDGKTMVGRIVPGALGYMFSGGNNIDSNAVNVALFTSCYAMGHGVSIVKNNFLRCITLFSARKLIMPDWINSQDEYLAPDESNPKFKEFVNDSVVFSLFHIHSNQSSLRNIEYKNNEKE